MVSIVDSSPQYAQQLAGIYPVVAPSDVTVKERLRAAQGVGVLSGFRFDRKPRIDGNARS